MVCEDTKLTTGPSDKGEAEMRVAGLVASHREGRAQPLSSRDLVRMATAAR